MNQINTQKELWRTRWLSSINELTSTKLQKKSWTDSLNTNPHGSFVEFMCRYFDDLAIDDNYNQQIEVGLITKIEFNIIQKWHVMLHKYNSPNNEDHNVQAIFDDQKWQIIIEKGQQVKLELSKTLDDKERAVLMSEIDYNKDSND